MLLCMRLWFRFAGVLIIFLLTDGCIKLFEGLQPSPMVSFTTPGPIQLSAIPIYIGTSTPIQPSDIVTNPTIGNNVVIENTGCSDNMEILESFGSIPENDSDVAIIWPGEVYVLGWRIRNNGTCVWDSAYSVERVSEVPGSDSSSFNSIKLHYHVMPGESYVFQFNLSAPIIPGDYSMGWKMLNGYHEQVGPLLVGNITIPSDEHNRPLPTMTVSPNVLFEISSTKVAPYSKVVLSWEVKHAKTVYFYPAGQVWESNQVPLEGVRVYYPTENTAYTLRVVNEDDTVVSYKHEVKIDPPLGIPDILVFNLVPKGKILLGQCIDIIWVVRGGNTTSVRIYANEVPLILDADRQGEYIDCPKKLGLNFYKIVASGRAGTDQKSKYLFVEP
jgi:hypothetical protein